MVWSFTIQSCIVFVLQQIILLKKICLVGEVFSLQYDGGLTMSVLSTKGDTPTKFSIGERVFMQDNKTYDILEGTVTMPPTTLNKYYTITLVDDS